MPAARRGRGWPTRRLREGVGSSGWELWSQLAARWEAGTTAGRPSPPTSVACTAPVVAAAEGQPLGCDLGVQGPGAGLQQLPASGWGGSFRGAGRRRHRPAGAGACGAGEGAGRRALSVTQCHCHDPARQARQGAGERGRGAAPTVPLGGGRSPGPAGALLTPINPHRLRESAYRLQARATHPRRHLWHGQPPPAAGLLQPPPSWLQRGGKAPGGRGCRRTLSEAGATAAAATRACAVPLRALPGHRLAGWPVIA